MEYVIITLGVISITAFIFYKLANVFGYPIHLMSLFLCAGCAVFLSLVVPRVIVSSAGFIGTVGVLAVIAVISAYFIAYYDRMMALGESAAELQHAQMSSNTNFSKISEDDTAATIIIDCYQPEWTLMKCTNIDQKFINSSAVEDSLDEITEDSGMNEETASEAQEADLEFATSIVEDSLDEITEDSGMNEEIASEAQEADLEFATSIVEDSLDEITEDSGMNEEIASEAQEANLEFATSIVEDKPDEIIEDSGMNEETASEAQEADLKFATSIVEDSLDEITEDSGMNEETASEVQEADLEFATSIVEDKPDEITEDSDMNEETASEAQEADLEFATSIVEDKPDEITEDSGMNEETASEVQEAEPELANEPIILATLGDINQCDSSIGIMQNTKVVEDGAMRADLVDVLSSSPTLDELMDYAFQQKECQEFEQALKAFEQAFKLYPDCDGAPFLIIEIGTLQKNAGMFDEAITTFVEGRRIAAKLNNNIFEKEFIDAIAYLRIAKNILLEHKMYHTPYKEIPIPIMDEINKEFLEWRNIS